MSEKPKSDKVIKIEVVSRNLENAKNDKTKSEKCSVKKNQKHDVPLKKSQRWKCCLCCLGVSGTGVSFWILSWVVLVMIVAIAIIGAILFVFQWLIPFLISIFFPVEGNEIFKSLDFSFQFDRTYSTDVELSMDHSQSVFEGDDQFYIDFNETTGIGYLKVTIVAHINGDNYAESDCTYQWTHGDSEVPDVTGSNSYSVVFPLNKNEPDIEANFTLTAWVTSEQTVNLTRTYSIGYYGFKMEENSAIIDIGMISSCHDDKIMTFQPSTLNVSEIIKINSTLLVMDCVEYFTNVEFTRKCGNKTCNSTGFMYIAVTRIEGNLTDGYTIFYRPSLSNNFFEYLMINSASVQQESSERRGMISSERRGKTKTKGFMKKLFENFDDLKKFAKELVKESDAKLEINTIFEYEPILKYSEAKGDGFKAYGITFGGRLEAGMQLIIEILLKLKYEKTVHIVPPFRVYKGLAWIGYLPIFIEIELGLDAMILLDLEFKAEFSMKATTEAYVVFGGKYYVFDDESLNENNFVPLFDHGITPNFEVNGSYSCAGTLTGELIPYIVVSLSELIDVVDVRLDINIGKTIKAESPGTCCGGGSTETGPVKKFIMPPPIGITTLVTGSSFGAMQIGSYVNKRLDFTIEKYITGKVTLEFTIIKTFIEDVLDWDEDMDEEELKEYYTHEFDLPKLNVTRKKCLENKLFDCCIECNGECDLVQESCAYDYSPFLIPDANEFYSDYVKNTKAFSEGLIRKTGEKTCCKNENLHSISSVVIDIEKFNDPIDNDELSTYEKYRQIVSTESVIVNPYDTYKICCPDGFEICQKSLDANLNYWYISIFGRVTVIDYFNLQQDGTIGEMEVILAGCFDPEVSKCINGVVFPKSAKNCEHTNDFACPSDSFCCGDLEKGNIYYGLMEYDYFSSNVLNKILCCEIDNVCKKISNHVQFAGQNENSINTCCNPPQVYNPNDVWKSMHEFEENSYYSHCCDEDQIISDSCCHLLPCPDIQLCCNDLSGYDEVCCGSDGCCPNACCGGNTCCSPTEKCCGNTCCPSDANCCGDKCCSSNSGCCNGNCCSHTCCNGVCCTWSCCSGTCKLSC